MSSTTYINVIKHLQVETTTYCNSFCPGCSRNIDGGEVNPHIGLEHMSMKTWTKLFENDSISALTLNGTFGDTMMNPNIVEMLNETANTGNITDMVSLHTNGGLRTQDYWRDLAKVLKRFKKHEVVFSIDGLLDTNHIHRRGTDFNKIIDNAKAFILEGGTASWRMIAFDHNKHQIEEAKLFAKKLGFRYFMVKQSYDKIMYAKKYKNLPETTITAPDDITDLKRYTEDFYPDREGVHFWAKENRSDEFENKFNCPWLNDLALQVDVKGRIWPCCYISDNANNTFYDNEWSMASINNNFPQDFNNINKFNLVEILSHNFFTKHLNTVWKNKESQICENCMNKEMI
jgi:MoaA/NifB/PqqE/SkfB family radical SAM enzyme